MSLSAACAWTLLRSIAVAVPTTVIAGYMDEELRRVDRVRRAILWALLLLPFLTPGLFTGYAYANFSLSLVNHPTWNELRYALVIAMKLLAVGTAVIHFSPPAPISREALYSARLTIDPSWSFWLRTSFMVPFWLRGPVRAAFPAFAIVFVLVFQEFEVAALLGTTSWTVWLFDAQTGGLVLSESLRLAMVPATCELLVIIAIVAFAFRSQDLMAATDRTPPHATAIARCFLWLLAICGCIAVFAIPLALIGRDTFTGFAMMVRNRALLREIAIAAGFGVTSGLFASLFAGALLKATSARSSLVAKKKLAPVAALAFVPGLLGSLIISLAVLRLFQTDSLRIAYNTPVPAVLALVVLLVPRAGLIQLMMHAARPQDQLHLATLLQDSGDASHRRYGGALDWVLHRRGQFLSACMISLWGYWEMTPIAILAPPGMTSAPVRLFNFMHYSRNDVLSAMTLTAMFSPLALMILVLGIHRLAARLSLRNPDEPKKDCGT